MRPEPAGVAVARCLGPLVVVALILAVSHPATGAWLGRVVAYLRWRARRALWRRWWTSLEGWQQEIFEQIHGPQEG